MQIITLDYQGHVLAYQDDGWFNATAAAAAFGKRVDHWLGTKETREYIAALCEITNTREAGYLKTKRGAGGGTWLHPKLAVQFARWCDPKFAVWCDTQIDSLLRGKDDWRKLRHESAASFKVMNHILQEARAAIGKDTASHHYINEARLINSLLSGEFKGMARDALSAEELALLAHLEMRNAVLIGQGFDYAQRKTILKAAALDWRLAHGGAIGCEV